MKYSAIRTIKRCDLSNLSNDIIEEIVQVRKKRKLN
jgi:hypothetical protein